MPNEDEEKQNRAKALKWAFGNAYAPMISDGVRQNFMSREARAFLPESVSSSQVFWEEVADAAIEELLLFLVDLNESPEKYMIDPEELER